MLKAQLAALLLLASTAGSLADSAASPKEGFVVVPLPNLTEADRVTHAGYMTVYSTGKSMVFISCFTSIANPPVIACSAPAAYSTAQIDKAVAGPDGE